MLGAQSVTWLKKRKSCRQRTADRGRKRVEVWEGEGEGRERDLD